MLLRLLRGRVLVGREEDFIRLLRQQVERLSPSRGLLSFMAGYRRVAGSDEFIMASTWHSEAEAVSVLGDDLLRRPRTMTRLSGVAEVTGIDHYRLLEPIYRGVLDAPGAVLRVSSATIRPGRLAELEAWIKRKSREMNAMQLLHGWALGVREDGNQLRGAGISAWASPLQIEAVADRGRGGQALFTALDEFVTDFAVEQYLSIELRLPRRLVDLAISRLIVARFAVDNAADRARAILQSRFQLPEAEVSVARLAHDESGHAQVLVARVKLADHAAAERVIVDHGGQIVHEADEGRRSRPALVPLH